MLGKVFERFVEKAPVAVMVRGILERVLSADALDRLYQPFQGAFSLLE
jgi:hypothetical protein